MTLNGCSVGHFSVLHHSERERFEALADFSQVTYQVSREAVEEVLRRWRERSKR